MLQARLIFDLLFHRGISPSGGRNQNFFSEVENMKPTSEGFKTVEKEDFSFLLSLSSSDQVFEIGSVSYLFSVNSIWEIGSSSLGSCLFSGIPTGGKWVCADYQTYALFSNGIVVISLDSNGDFAYTEEVPVGKEMVNYNGQLLIGNHTLNYNEFIPNAIPSLEIGKSFISYSGIGNIDCVVSEDNIEAGYQCLLELGEIVGISVLNNSPIVLGTRGVVRLLPVEHFFGKRVISSVGPRDSFSWCLGEGVLYFIDGKGKLWGISGEEKVSLLGFGYLFKDLGTRMFFKKNTEEVFIKTEGKTFVLNSEGLYSLTGNFLASIGSGDRFLVSSIPSLENGKFITSIFDFKDPGLKVIEEISLGVDSGVLEENLSFRIHTREKINGPWFLSPLYRLNNENVCKPHVAGSEFKIEFFASGFSYSSPDWMIVQYDKIDKRYNRGHSFVDINKEG